jgi:hypothetical protein
MYIRWKMEDMHVKKTEGCEEEDLERETRKECSLKNTLRRNGIK